MYLFLSIFIFLIITQFVMGLFASYIRRGLKDKHSYYLGEQVEFNKILESAKEKSKELSIIASDQIDDVCIAENNLIIVNKKSIYSKDMYSNLYLLFQLKLTSPKLKEIRLLYNYQSIVFFSQIIILVLFFLLPQINQTILLIGFVLFFLSIFLISYGIVVYGSILKEVLKEAKSILKLDNVEQARAEALSSEIKYEILTYPLELPTRLSRFWR